MLKWNLVVLVSVDSLHTNKRTRRDVELGHIILQHWKKRETARRLVTSPSQFIRWVVEQFYVVLVDVIYVVAQRMNTHKQAKVEWKGIKKKRKREVKPVKESERQLRSICGDDVCLLLFACLAELEWTIDFTISLFFFLYITVYLSIFLSLL